MEHPQDPCRGHLRASGRVRPETKAGRRIVELAPVVVEALKLHHRRVVERQLELGIRPDHGYVFTDELLQPLHPDSISDRFERFVRAGGLPRISLHGLRHTVGSVLAAEGENPEAIRALLGHENVRTTLSLYVHTSPEERRRTASRMAAAVGR